MDVNEEKREAVNAAITQCTKDYGKGVVMWMNDAPLLEIEAIPTGSLSLDRAIGIGGVPRGRVTEIIGPESVGKSSLLQHILAEGQKMGEICALIDAEHSLDKKYATACGVDVDNLVLSQPDYGEQGLNIAGALIRSGGVGVVVVDSVAALTPRAELEGEIGDQNIGLQARMMGQTMRMLAGVVMKSRVALCFSNQIREAVGKFSPHGTPETTPGGRALRHYASLRLDMRRIEDIKQGKEIIGVRSRVKVKKSKLAPPLKEAMIDILYGIGIDKASDALDVGVDVGVIKRGGAYYTFQDIRWQGRESAILAIRNEPELFAAVDKAIRNAM